MMRGDSDDPIEGRVIYFLVLIALIQTLYPMSISSSPLILIAYQIFYVSMMGVGISLVRNNRLHVAILSVTSVSWVVVGAIYAFNPEQQWANLTGYAVLAVFQGLLIYILLRYIFSTRIITRDILYASCAVYILLGAIFVPIYGTIETLSWFPNQEHAFLDGVNEYPDEPVPWQTFIYYSYVTLTSLGYGDILPATHWARSMASFQSMIGSLYITIVMSWLVGLYATHEVEEQFAKNRKH